MNIPVAAARNRRVIPHANAARDSDNDDPADFELPDVKTSP